MPTYEYECKSCGGVFDVFQSIKARPLRTSHCDACGKARPVRRLIGTGGAVLFKGSGFYQTDYRSKGYQEKAKAESGSTDSAKKESATKTQTPDTAKSSEAPAITPEPKAKNKDTN